MTTIRVDGRNGGWEVAVSEPDEHVPSGSLEEARRVAYDRAAATGPCEVVVRDAYHRVVQREVRAGRATGAGTSRPAARASWSGRASP